MFYFHLMMYSLVVMINDDGGEDDLCFTATFVNMVS